MESKIPLYKKVFSDLKRLIDDNKFPVGSFLPSENELCEKYLTTRATVRHAIKELLIIGYIKRHQGRRSIVVEPKKGLGILSIRGVTAAIGDTTLKTKILKKPKVIQWPSDFFYEMSEAEKKAGCILFSRLRLVNNLPVLYEETFLTNISLPGFTSINLENKSLFGILNEKFSIAVREGDQKIWAIKATEPISRFLKIKQHAPVLYLQRKLKTDNNKVCIYSSLFCNTKDYYLQDYF